MQHTETKTRTAHSHRTDSAMRGSLATTSLVHVRLDARLRTYGAHDVDVFRAIFCTRPVLVLLELELEAHMPLVARFSQARSLARGELLPLERDVRIIHFVELERQLPITVRAGVARPRVTLSCCGCCCCWALGSPSEWRGSCCGSFSGMWSNNARAARRSKKRSSFNYTHESTTLRCRVRARARETGATTMAQDKDTRAMTRGRHRSDRR